MTTKLLLAAAVAACGLFVLSAEQMPVAQQNALVQKYCGVCHDDAKMTGGLSLEHFDAAHPDPTVAAMMVSKLTGLSLKQVEAARSDAGAAAIVVKKLETGAMGAAGIGVPDRPTQDALLRALSAEAAGATRWNFNRRPNPATQAPVLTASILQEVPSATQAGETSMYRLTLTCRADTQEAGMQLAWAAATPEEGHQMFVAADGKAPFTQKIEGGQKQGNGKGGPGAVMLPPTLPAKTLTITNIFPDERVVFPFGGLGQGVRQELSKYFSGRAAAH